MRNLVGCPRIAFTKLFLRSSAPRFSSSRLAPAWLYTATDDHRLSHHFASSSSFRNFGIFESFGTYFICNITGRTTWEEHGISLFWVRAIDRRLEGRSPQISKITGMISGLRDVSFWM